MARSRAGRTRSALLDRLHVRAGDPRPDPPLRLRPLGPDDGAALDEVFAGMSPRSRYLRFHAPVHRLTPSMRASLLAVDGHSHVGAVAEALTPHGWRAVGIGRLVRIGPQRAELAVEVVDDWHGRGVGRRLLDELKDRATLLGHRELHAEVLLENTAILALLQRTFPGARLQAQGQTGTVVCPVGDAAALAGARLGAWDAALVGR